MTNAFSQTNTPPDTHEHTNTHHKQQTQPKTTTEMLPHSNDAHTSRHAFTNTPMEPKIPNKTILTHTCHPNLLWVQSFALKTRATTDLPCFVVVVVRYVLPSTAPILALMAHARSQRLVLLVLAVLFSILVASLCTKVYGIRLIDVCPRTIQEDTVEARSQHICWYTSTIHIIRKGCFRRPDSST